MSLIQIQFLFEGKCQGKVENCYFCIIQTLETEERKEGTQNRLSLIPSRDSCFLSRSNCLQAKGDGLRLSTEIAVQLHQLANHSTVLVNKP